MHLSPGQGFYAFRGHQILFVSQNDADQIQRVQGLALQESDWKNAQMKAAAKQIRQMQELQKSATL
jgi:hypothetical protein